jgi:hypothetical protein
VRQSEIRPIHYLHICQQAPQRSRLIGRTR